MKFSDLTLDTLRFYLTGENETIAQLYEFLFNHVLQVVFLAPEGTANPSPIVFSPRESLFPVGFDIDDGLLPYPSQSFLGYRLLSEYFALPEKFHFLDLGGFRQVCRSGFQKRLDVLLFLEPRFVQARARHQRGDLPAGLHAGDQPVRANRRTDPADPGPIRVPYRTRRGEP